MYIHVTYNSPALQSCSKRGTTQSAERTQDQAAAIHSATTRQSRG